MSLVCGWFVSQGGGVALGAEVTEKGEVTEILVGGKAE